MRFTERRQRFRTVINCDVCVHPGSIFDPISARIAEDIGFEIGMFAGSIASFTVLGAPDIIALTLSELAQQCQRISRASTIPFMVDADHGYGNALNAKRTVEELEMAGVSGLSIEDTDLPQPFGKLGQTTLLSLEEGVGKMNAALSGRNDPNLVIAGRTSAPSLTGVEDTIARITAYEACGVDMIFLVGVKSRTDLEAIASNVSKPIMLGSVGSPDMMDKEYLASQGVRICLQGHQPFAAAVQALCDTLQALRHGTAPEDLQGVASKDLMARVTRAQEYDLMTRNWLEG